MQFRVGHQLQGVALDHHGAGTEVARRRAPEVLSQLAAQGMRAEQRFAAVLIDEAHASGAAAAQSHDRIGQMLQNACGRSDQLPGELDQDLTLRLVLRRAARAPRQFGGGNDHFERHQGCGRPAVLSRTLGHEFGHEG